MTLSTHALNQFFLPLLISNCIHSWDVYLLVLGQRIQLQQDLLAKLEDRITPYQLTQEMIWKVVDRFCSIANLDLSYYHISIYKVDRNILETRAHLICDLYYI